MYENHQVFRIDGKDVFFEVLNSAFPIGKVQINFIEYDPNNGNKQKKNIQCYMDIPKFLVLSNDILSGKMSVLAKKAQEEKSKNKLKYCKEVFGDMGGITNKRLSSSKYSFNFEIPEGMSVSRILYLTPGERQPWILSGQLGIGKENDKGLIVPQGYPKEIVRVPTDDEGLKALALVVHGHIMAYYNSLYRDGLAL